jgi:hypothetical protein
MSKLEICNLHESEILKIGERVISEEQGGRWKAEKKTYEGIEEQMKKDKEQGER